MTHHPVPGGGDINVTPFPMAIKEIGRDFVARLKKTTSPINITRLVGSKLILRLLNAYPLTPFLFSKIKTLFYLYFKNINSIGLIGSLSII